MGTALLWVKSCSFVNCVRAQSMSGSELKAAKCHFIDINVAFQVTAEFADGSKVFHILGSFG